MLSQQIRRCRPSLVQQRYASIDMSLWPAERKALAKVTVECELPQYDYFGSSSKTLRTTLGIHLRKMGTNSSEDLAQITDVVVRLSEGMREGFEKESTWTMVRVSLPNDAFAIPRWHTDGKYYDSHPGEKQYKLVATLKGAPTLFSFATDMAKVETLMQATNEEPFDLTLRKELAKVVAQKDLGNANQAVIYRVGDSEAVMHSEPHITEPRIFVSVLPGTTEQIRQWQEKTVR